MLGSIPSMFSCDHVKTLMFCYKKKTLKSSCVDFGSKASILAIFAGFEGVSTSVDFFLNLT